MEEMNKPTLWPRWRENLRPALAKIVESLVEHLIRVQIAQALPAHNTDR
jgi:hypothetical protein